MSSGPALTEPPLAGRVALVTGAGRGIGRAIAHRLAADGAIVAVNDLDHDVTDVVVAEIVAAGGRARSCPASVLDPDATRRLAAGLLADLGRVDVLVSNAGVASSGRSVRRTPIDELDEQLRLHAHAPFLLCQALLPAMRARGWGRIVMVSSTAVTEAPRNAAPYTMAKAALEALARCVAKEEADHGVTVNVVAPGLVATRLGELVQRRLGGSAEGPGPIAPELVADAVAYCVSSPAAGALHGQRLSVGP